MRTVLALLLACPVALAQQTTSLQLTLDQGAVTCLVNRLTGETCTRPAGPADHNSAVSLLVGPGSPRDVFSGQEGVTLDPTARTDGADVVVQQRAQRAAGGLTGTWLGVGPIDAGKINLLIPGAGGVILDRDSRVTDVTYYYPGAWGTPAVALQGDKGGILISADQPAHSFKALRVTRLATAWRLMLLTSADAPFASRTQCSSAAWRFTAYRGPWTVAAGLQRERLRKEFALTPIAQRPPDWLKHIRCVVRVVGTKPGEGPLQALAREVDPTRTLLYLPDWRTHPYDVMYPDFTPAPTAVEFIRQAHALGFRVMAHGNLVGISPFYPQMAQFEDAIERDPVSGQPIGWYLDRDVPNKIYCLNPAFAKSRKLLIDSYVASYKQAGFDALHLDFPYIINPATGPVEGRNPIEGTVQLLRELERALPGVPLGTEGISDYMLDCAFAQLGEPFWNSNESQGRYHPFRAAIFSDFCNVYGHLGIPDQQSDLQAYMSFIDAQDRTGCLPTFTLNRDAGLDFSAPGTRYALREAKQFLAHEPAPDYAATLQSVAMPGDPPACPSFAWRQSDGQVLAVVQTPSGRKWLCGGGGKPWQELWRVYQRVTQIAGDLHLPGWLAYNEGGAFGLDPTAIYVPVPGRPDPATFHLTRAGTPLRVGLCGADDRRDLIRLERLQSDGLDLTAIRPDSVGMLVKGAEKPLGNGGSFSLDTGICGGVARRGIFAHPPWQFPETTQPNGRLDTASFGEFRLKLPDVAGLAFMSGIGLRDLLDPKSPGGDGAMFRVCVNGKEVLARLHTERNWEDITVDLSAWRGQEITLRLLTDPGPAGRPDFDWALWGEPHVAVDPAAQRVPIEFTVPPTGGTLLVAETTGTHRLAADARRADVALPAALLCLRNPVAVAGPVALAQVPYGTSLMNGGVLTRGSVYGAGAATSWQDGEQARPSISGHTPAWGQTHLEWALSLPATPLKLIFSAAVVKDGEQVSFAAMVNGLTVWSGGWPGSGRAVAGSVDLSRWAGQPVLLSLVTDSEGSNNCDWAVWVEPRLEAMAVATP